MNFGAFAGGMAGGITAGFKMSQDLADRKAKNDALLAKSNKDLRDYQLKLDKEAETRRHNMATEEQKVKDSVFKIEDSFSKIAIKNPTVAVSSSNRMYENQGINKRRYMTDGFVYEGTAEQSEAFKAIKHDLDKFKGNGLYKESKTGQIFSRKTDAEEFGTEPVFHGRSLDSYEASDDDRLKKSEMIEVVIDGKVVEWTRDRYDNLTDDKKPKLAPTSSSENLTNEDKFVKAYLKTHKNADRVEASTAYANRNIPSVVKVEDKASNIISSIGTDLGVDLYNYNVSTADQKTKNRVQAMGASALRMTHGKKATKIIGDSKRVLGNISRLEEASSSIDKSIDEGKNVNFLEKMYRDLFGKYTDVKMSDEDYKTLATNKQVSEVFNAIRHSLYGSVLTVGENKNFFDQAASLYESNPSLLIGINATVESQIKELEALELEMGNDVFRTQFGNRLEALQDRYSELQTVMKNKSTKKSNTAQKSSTASFNPSNEDYLKWKQNRKK